MRILVAIVLVVGLTLGPAELQAKRPPAGDIAKSIYLGDPDYPLCKSREHYSAGQSEPTVDTRVLFVSRIQRIHLRLGYLENRCARLLGHYP